jgi:hypothetical protein
MFLININFCLLSIVVPFITKYPRSKQYPPKSRLFVHSRSCLVKSSKSSSWKVPDCCLVKRVGHVPDHGKITESKNCLRPGLTSVFNFLTMDILVPSTHTKDLCHCPQLVACKWTMPSSLFEGLASSQTYKSSRLPAPPLQLWGALL